MKKKVLSILLATTLVVGALAGCGSTQDTAGNAGNASSSAASQTAKESEAGSSAADQSGNEDFITINSCFAVGMTGAVNKFAIEKGLYEAEGIRFNNIDWSSNDEVLSLITRGEIDVADGDPSAYIPGISNGVPAKLVGNMWRYSGCYWLVAQNDVQTIADLKGKSVGTAAAAGGMRLSVLKMLEAEGLSESDVDLVANGVYQGAYATLTTGEVSATIIHNPYAALAEAEGTGHILGRAWDYIPDYYTGTIIASDKIIQNDPEKLQRFVTAYYKVHEEVKNEHFDEFVTWAAEYMNTDEAVMRKAIESEIDVWLDYPVIPVDRVNNTVDILHQYGWMDASVTADGTYDNTFAEKAAAELGMEDPYK
ncbi:MAG: ABC transporter substrate-binding protein [Lachnospiraceae bacterium]|nr:ABC transporter substrate-binding protein [Lachnospiraceae bacterium]